MNTPKDLQEARKIQLRLAQKIRIIPLKKTPRYIAGADAAFHGDEIFAAACLFTYPELLPVEDALVCGQVPFPYIPGFLSFREGPAIIEAVGRLSIRPALLLFDGQGTAHPSGIGIASHIGVILGIPSIGCAKSRLIGDFREPGMKKGQYAFLKYRGTTVGAVLRTRDHVRPLYVSPGHLVDLDGAIHYALGCVGKFRIPEPLRRADHLSKKIKGVRADIP